MVTKNWNGNILKEKVNSGLEHLTKSGNIIWAKSVWYDKMCTVKCSFKCYQNFNEIYIIKIHDSYYKLNHKDKLNFLLNFTDRISRTGSKKHAFTFCYYLPNNKDQQIRMCKIFFNPLVISQTFIYNVH